MPNTVKSLSDRKAADLLANFLSARDHALDLQAWELQLKSINKVFAFKHHELAVKTSEPRGPMNNYNSLRNITDDLPTDVEELKEAVDALDGQHASRKRRHADNGEADGKQAVSVKRRRTEKNETIAVQSPDGKGVKVEWVTKGQTEVIGLTLRRPSD